MTSIGPIYHVYDVGIELSNAGLAPSEGIVGGARRCGPSYRPGNRARRCAGALLVAVERRLRPSTQAIRSARLAARAVLILVAVVGAVVLRERGARVRLCKRSLGDVQVGQEDAQHHRATDLSELLEQRYDYRRVAVNTFREEPLLGLGAGNYGRRYDAERRYAKPSRYAHDIWLRTLAEGGVVGILLLLGFVVVALGGLLSVRRRGEPGAALLAAIALVVSSYFFIHASFDWLEEFPALVVPAFAFPLVALAASASERTSAARSRHPGMRLGYAVGISVAAVALAALTIQFLALRYYERGGTRGAQPVGRLRRPRQGGRPQPALG